MTLDKLTRYKRQLTVIAALYFLTIGCGVAAHLFIERSTHDMRTQKSRAEEKTMQLSKQLNSNKEKLNQIITAKRLWDKVEKKYKIQEGMQIDTLRTIVTALQKRYHITADIVISRPTLVNEQFKSKYYDIYQINASLTLTGPTDELILQFIEHLLHVFPGYVSITSLHMNRKGDLPKSSPNSKPSDAMQAKIELLWRDVKENTSAGKVGL